MPDSKPTSEPFAPRAKFSHVYPLDEFYAQRGETLPAIGRLKAEELPKPYQTLLAHRGDMTSTLEKFHNAKIHIKVLAQHTFENEYFREVVLRLDGSEKPVEFGAIKIILDLFPHDVQKEILQEKYPLGHILAKFKIEHASRPQNFLSIASDDFINRALQLTGAHSLYGRRNTLVDPWDRPLAEIVEILPP
ncbi:MAG: hypothetical protein M3Y82_11655 [Verrucomicrobiota bacterium]|nr:hypothetical protein [Verrucomicrobiota bacterium]